MVSAWGSQSAGSSETETGGVSNCPTSTLTTQVEKGALCFPEGKGCWKSAVTTGAAKAVVGWVSIPRLSSFLLSPSAEMCNRLLFQEYYSTNSIQITIKLLLLSKPFVRIQTWASLVLISFTRCNGQETKLKTWSPSLKKKNQNPTPNT